MSKYPLDQEALAEEYGDLLIKIALKAYMKEQAQLLEQEEAEAAPVPAPKGNVVAAAFRQVNLEDAKETILSGLKKGVTRVAVVLLAAAITFTTAFAVSGTVRTGVFQHVINVIRKYSDLLANTSVMVEQPRYRYDELNVLEIPNEQVQEAFDVWVSFRDIICHSGHIPDPADDRLIGKVILDRLDIRRTACADNGGDGYCGSFPGIIALLE